MENAKTKYMEMILLPCLEEETTKGGEEESGLQTRVDEVNSLETVLEGDRNSVVD